MRAGDEAFDQLRAALEQLAGSDAAEVLADARAEAKVRVRSMLNEALSHSMLERIHDQLETPAPEALDEDRHRPEGSMIWYVYGIGRAERWPAEIDIAGVDPAHRVTVVSGEGLGAVASRVRQADFSETSLREHLADMEWVEKTARAHEHVLEEVRQVMTVVPMRMCTVYRSDDGVRELLGRQHDALEAALRDLDGRTEWGVKVLADRTRARPAAAEDAPCTDAETGAAYMQRVRQGRDDHQRAAQAIEEACTEIHERLCACAADGLLAPLHRKEASSRGGEMVLNGAYLVADAHQAAFDDELIALQSEFDSLGLELVKTGPWPAYNFIPERIGVAW